MNGERFDRARLREGMRRAVGSLIVVSTLSTTMVAQSIRSLTIELVVPGFTVEEGTAVVLDASTFGQSGHVKSLDGTSVGTPAVEPGVPIHDGVAIVKVSGPAEGFMMFPRLSLMQRGVRRTVSFTPAVTFRVTDPSLETGRLTVELPRSVLVDLSVLDRQGAPLPRAVVSVLGGAMEESAAVTTSDTGTATILLPAGDYRCRRRGDRSSAVRFQVRGDEAEPIRLVIRSEG